MMHLCVGGLSQSYPVHSSTVITGGYRISIIIYQLQCSSLHIVLKISLLLFVYPSWQIYYDLAYSSGKNILVEVLFLDYGNGESRKPSHLRKLPEKYASLPAQGILCALSQVCKEDPFNQINYTPHKRSFGRYIGITLSDGLSVQNSCPFHIFLKEKYWKFLFPSKIAYDLREWHDLQPKLFW